MTRTERAEQVMTDYYWHDIAYAEAISRLADLHPHVPRLEIARRLYLLMLQFPETAPGRLPASRAEDA